LFSKQSPKHITYMWVFLCYYWVWTSILFLYDINNLIEFTCQIDRIHFVCVCVCFVLSIVTSSSGTHYYLQLLYTFPYRVFSFGGIFGSAAFSFEFWSQFINRSCVLTYLCVCVCVCVCVSVCFVLFCFFFWLCLPSC